MSSARARAPNNKRGAAGPSGFEETKRKGEKMERGEARGRSLVLLDGPTLIQLQVWDMGC